MAEHRKARPAAWPRRIRTYTPRHATTAASQGPVTPDDEGQAEELLETRPDGKLRH